MEKYTLSGGKSLEKMFFSADPLVFLFCSRIADKNRLQGLCLSDTRNRPSDFDGKRIIASNTWLFSSFMV